MTVSSTPRSADGALAWPLPALLGWLGAWVGFALAQGLGVAAPLAWLLGAAMPLPAAVTARGPWRRALVMGGFPLSSVVTGVALPPWAWALAALALLLLYPVRAWRDAPVFPTPLRALRELPQALPLAPGARVLDAGCGLGHGLRALHAVWPQARLHGVEWSRPVAAWCAWRCRYAQVRRGDLWQHDWSAYDAVYLFQRPESMARAWHKACGEMGAGRWLISLEFEVPGVAPVHRLDAGGGRPLWLYRTGAPSIPGPRRR